MVKRSVKQKGFSLIYFIVFLIVAGSISFVFFKYYDPIGALKDKNNFKKMNDLNSIKQAVEYYYGVHGKYPKYSDKDPKYRIIRLDGSVADWGQQWTPYMSILPRDESPDNYVYFSDGQKYYLYASLNKRPGFALCKTDGSVCDGIINNNIPPNACGGICNYGISSANVSP